MAIDRSWLRNAQVSITEKGLWDAFLDLFDAGATGTTATAAELNYLDITTLGTGAASKAVVLNASGDYTFPATATIVMPSSGDMTFASGSTLDVAGTFEIANVAMTASAAELNYNDITTLGTGAASKAVVLDAGEDYTWPATGVLTYGVLKDPAATTITATGAEINFLDITALGTGAASKAVVLDADGRYRLPSTGTLFNAGKETKAQAAPAAKTATEAISAAELVAGLITTTGATAPSIHQLPTGTDIDAAFPGIAVGDSFDFHLINTGVGAGDDATITVNTDVTIVGNPTVGALTDATILSGSGTFRARRSAANEYVVYRIA